MPNAVLPVNFNTPFGYVTLCDPITEREAGGSLVGPFPPPTPTKAQVSAALIVTLAVAETIREAGKIPSGRKLMVATIRDILGKEAML